MLSWANFSQNDASKHKSDSHDVQYIPRNKSPLELSFCGQTMESELLFRGIYCTYVDTSLGAIFRYIDVLRDGLQLYIHHDSMRQPVLWTSVMLEMQLITSDRQTVNWMQWLWNWTESSSIKELHTLWQLICTACIPGSSNCNTESSHFHVHFTFCGNLEWI